jgi:hypothetical protein
VGGELLFGNGHENIVSPHEWHVDRLESEIGRLQVVGNIRRYSEESEGDEWGKTLFRIEN